MPSPLRLSPSPSLQVSVNQLTRGLDALGVGLLVCTPEGAPQYQSERAQQLLYGRGAERTCEALRELARSACNTDPLEGSSPTLRYVEHGRGAELAVTVVAIPGGALVFLRPVYMWPLPEEHLQGFDLTAAEKAIARRLARRLTNKEIADEMGVSPHTVKHHVERILSKLGISSRKEVRRVLRKAPG